MKFTEEQRKRINRLLEEGEEYQRQTGNKTYTIEEVRNEILKQYYKHLEEWNISKKNTTNLKKKEENSYKYL